MAIWTQSQVSDGEKMSQMEELHIFPSVLYNRSISKAADQLNIAKSAVSRRLNLLEERYSAKLINRSPGRWDVTETGLELYQRATRVVDDFEEIEADFKSVHSDISGPLTVSVPRDFGLSFLSKALVSFKEKYDNIQLTVLIITCSSSKTIPSNGNERML